MKRLLLLFCTIPMALSSQTNVFPASGNVGIGTTTPEKKLDVIGQVKADSYAFPLVQYDFSLAPRTQLSAMSMQLFDDYHTVRPGGDTPDNNRYGTLLAIYGRPSHWQTDIFVGADTKRMYFRTSTWRSGNSENQVTGGFHNWRTILDSRSNVASSGKLQLTGSGNHFIEHGNLGIGTTTPDAKLAVNGIIHSKEVKVDLTGWSDFVFEEGYPLPTLKEVEQHIKTKGYLKDIPNAQEVRENGILLGDINAKLLQKIEELTLYIIAQDKKIQRLEKENTRIEKLEEKLNRILDKI